MDRTGTFFMELNIISTAAFSSNRTEWKSRIGIKNNGIMGAVEHGRTKLIIIIIIVIIFIKCNFVITLWQWLFYMYTNMEKKVTRKFKSGGLHEKHVVATWKLGNHLSIRL